MAWCRDVFFASGSTPHSSPLNFITIVDSTCHHHFHCTISLHNSFLRVLVSKMGARKILDPSKSSNHFESAISGLESIPWTSHSRLCTRMYENQHCSVAWTGENWGPTHHWVPSRSNSNRMKFYVTTKRRCMHRTNLPECPMFIKSQSCRTVNKTCQGFPLVLPSIISMGPGDRTVLKNLKLCPCPLVLVITQKRLEGRSRGRIYFLVLCLQAG